MAQSEPKKYALLVGCNYPLSNYPGLAEDEAPTELFGCINDVLSIKEVLIERFGFHAIDINVLTDDPAAAGSSSSSSASAGNMLTAATIREELEKLVSRAKSGDVLFFHFSGHGTLIDDERDHSHDDPLTTNLLTPGSDEAIVAPDLNLITDFDFRTLVNDVPDGATFTICSDSCHSGGLIANEKEQIGPHHSIPGLDYEFERRKKFIPITAIMQHLRDIHDIPHDDTHHIGNLLVHVFGNHASKKFTLPGHELDSKIQQLKIDEGILLSGCQANEFSHEYHTNDGSCVGAFSYAVQMVLQDNPLPLTNREVVNNARIKIREEGFEDQHPCLYCNDENADAFFLHQ